MKPWNVVFLDSQTFDREGDISYEAFTNEWPCRFYKRTQPNEVQERIKGCQVIVTNKVVLSAEALAFAKEHLKLVAVAATGLNNVDVEAANESGIQVRNVAGYSSESVAQFTFALILELTSNVGRLSADNRNGAWATSPIFTQLTYPNCELQGKTLGLVGNGNIGQAVARIATGFGMKVMLAARPGDTRNLPSRVPWEQMLTESDIVSLHCPLTDQTRDLIEENELKRMKPTALLINTARGGIVNEAALIRSLEENEIAGAGFDVITEEPPPENHPMLNAASRLSQLLLTPHCAWACVEARQRLLDGVFQNIQTVEQLFNENKCD